MASPFVHPWDTITGAAKTGAYAMGQGMGVPMPEEWNPASPVIEQFMRDKESGDLPLALENLAGMGLGTWEGGRIAGEVIPRAARPLGVMARKAAIGMDNATFGAKTASMEPQFTPGAGRLHPDSGIWPKLTPAGVAKAAAKAKLATGTRISTALDDAGASGVRIPTGDYVDTVTNNLSNARDTLNGPFGPGSGAIDNRLGSLLPNPDDAGGYLPKTVWDVKKGIGDNVNWTDPTQVGVKSVGQDLAGRGTPELPGLSPLIENAVPEMKDLNPLYHNLSDLEEATLKQANSRRPLFNLRRMGEIGSAMWHPGVGLPLLAGDMAAGSTYGRMLAASGLNNIGKLLSPGAGVAGEIPSVRPPFFSTGSFPKWPGLPKWPGTTGTPPPMMPMNPGSGVQGGSAAGLNFPKIGTNESVAPDGTPIFGLDLPLTNNPSSDVNDINPETVDTGVKQPVPFGGSTKVAAGAPSPIASLAKQMLAGDPDPKVDIGTASLISKYGLTGDIKNLVEAMQEATRNLPPEVAANLISKSLGDVIKPGTGRPPVISSVAGKPIGEKLAPKPKPKAKPPEEK
jgi:hypothetical protein